MEEGIILFITTFLIGIIAFPFAGKVKNAVKIFLSFSGAFLLAVCALHILPEVYQSGVKNIGLFVLVGFLFQILMEFYSGGAEHGHAHVHGKKQTVPWGIVISLCLHAALEGMPFGFDHQHDDHSYLAGILMHKLPVAFVLTSLLIGQNLKRNLILLILGVFSFMPFLGGVIIENTPQLLTYFPQIMALVLGMMLHISTTILFEVSENHKFNRIKFSSVIVGFVLAYFVMMH